ncbi:hypothetical protein EB796_018117 [Bugula neritina]|uniref:Uncharacterized protein n=1 Tax=Bugula neritina TaxID=10212 RepID=A0A7J7JDW7_BUGNE|nr:hypothetical protein EB796_018117 [Bugula neritina]
MTVLSIFVKLNCSSSFLSDFRAVKSKLSTVNFFDTVVPMEVKYLLKLFAMSLSSVSVIFSNVKLLGAFNPFDRFFPRCSLMTFQHLLESEVFSKKDSKYEVLDLRKFFVTKFFRVLCLNLSFKFRREFKDCL